MAIGLAGMGDLFAIWRGIRWLRYVFKPGTMLLIIALAATGLPEAGAFGYLVLAGLLFSAARATSSWSCRKTASWRGWCPSSVRTSCTSPHLRCAGPAGVSSIAPRCWRGLSPQGCSSSAG